MLNLGRTVFMVLFLFLCISFSARSEKSSYYNAHCEQLTELHSYTENAVVAGFIQMPVYHADLLTFTDKTGFSFCNTRFRLSAYNNNIAQRIIYLEQSISSLKPLSYCGFYYHLFSSNTRELPALS